MLIAAAMLSALGLLVSETAQGEQSDPLPSYWPPSSSVRWPVGIEMGFGFDDYFYLGPSPLGIRWTNFGSVPLTITSFTDDPIDGRVSSSAGMTVADGALNVTCTAGGQPGTFAPTANKRGVVMQTPTTIPAGGSCTLRIGVSLASLPDGQYTFVNSLPEGATVFNYPGIVSPAISASYSVTYGLSVSLSANPLAAPPGSAIQYLVVINNFSSPWDQPIVLTDFLTEGQTLLRGTVNGIDYEPRALNGCQLLRAEGEIGASSITLTSRFAFNRGETQPPPSCRLRFYVMTPMTPTTVHNIVPAFSACNGDRTACNGVDSPSTSVTPMPAMSAQIDATTRLIESVPGRLTINLFNNTRFPLQGLSLSGSLLPTSTGAALRIADVPQAASTCGDAEVAATPGGSAFTLSASSVPARTMYSSEPSCVISLNVVGDSGEHALSAVFDATTTFANGTSALLSTSSLGTMPIVIERSLNADLSGTNTRYQATTDGQIILRYLLGIRGPALTASAIASDARRTDPQEIAAHLEAQSSKLDIDGNGKLDPATDGLLVIRYLFGMRGDALIADLLDGDGIRSTVTAVEAWLAAQFQ
jgi:hypothetical protein